jgi:hypothetical protein
MKLAWDRLLETCVRLGNNALLVAGFPPCWRFEDGLRHAAVPAVSAEELDEMLLEVLPGPGEVDESRGCRSFTLNYGSDFKFRIGAVGRTPPKVLTITRLPAVPLAGEEQVVAGLADSAAAEQNSRWRRIVAQSDEVHCRTGLVAAGCAPLLWWELGLHPLESAPLDLWQVRQTVADIWPPAEYRRRVDGYDTFDLGYDRDKIFRTAVFDADGEPVVVFMRVNGET